MIRDDKLKNTYDENSFKDRIDMFVRKLSSNSTYTIVKAILGFDLGMIYDNMSEYHRKNEKAGYDFYRFRNYGKKYRDLDIHRNFDTSYVAKYDIVHNRIKLNVERQTKIDAGYYKKIKPHDISMLDNFMINSTLPYNEYLYKCSLDLSPINTKGMIRLHEYLFPVYIDKFKGSNYDDWELANIIKTFGIEVSFGRDKISKLSDFKMKYVFANELENDNVIGARVTAYENNIRGFEFVRWDDVTTHKRNRNVLLQSGEHTEYSRVRNSRGNHIYKYRMTAMSNNANSETWDTSYFDRRLRGYFMHADMVYGMQRAMIHPQYTTPDENYRKWLVDMVGGYSMNSLIPNYPTVYVDFCAQHMAHGQKGADEIFADNMHLIGFIRIRLYSSNNAEKADLNVGVIQNNYGEGKRNSSAGCTREITNSESFTVKIIIPKRNPLMLYERNSTNGEQIYMLPPNIFNCQYIYNNSISPILENIEAKFSYKFMDSSGFYSSNGYQYGTRWKSGSKDNLICAQGGWLFPPLRFADFSGSTEWKNLYSMSVFDDVNSMNHYYNNIPATSDMFMKNLNNISGSSTT